MIRLLPSCLLAAALSHGAGAQSADEYPFDEWLKGKNDLHVRWLMHVTSPRMTSRQYLETSVSAYVDEQDFRKEHHSNPILLLQFEDADRRLFRVRTEFRGGRRRGADPRTYLAADEQVCVAPGIYEIAGAVYDPESKRHAIRRARLRVPPIAHDVFPALLPEAPRVMPVRACFALRPELPLNTDQPLHVEFIINRPIDPTTGVAALFGLLTSMKLAAGSMTATVVDLGYRRTRTRDILGPTDWGRFISGFPRTNRYTVDARTFDRDGKAAQFFMASISKRLEASFTEPRRAIIIASDRRSFRKSEDLRPIEAPVPEGTRIFYVRLNGSGPRPFGFPERAVPPTRHDSISEGPFPVPVDPPKQADSIEPTLAPLGARVFHVTTVFDIRHAVGDIMKDLTRRPQ